MRVTQLTRRLPNVHVLASHRPTARSPSAMVPTFVSPRTVAAVAVARRKESGRGYAGPGRMRRTHGAAMPGATKRLLCVGAKEHAHAIVM